jgi:diguanylate cyclase
LRIIDKQTLRHNHISLTKTHADNRQKHTPLFCANRAIMAMKINNLLTNFPRQFFIGYSFLYLTLMVAKLTADSMSTLSPTMASDRAIGMMRQLGVAPTPKHYSIFFSCMCGSPVALVKEIESLIERKASLSAEVLEKLYFDHLSETQVHAVQESASNAKKILAEMMATVATFTGVTQNASEGMEKQLEQLSDGELTEETLRQMAQAVIHGAKSIKSSSDVVQEKLEAAQKEVVALRENLTRATEESEKDFLTGCYNRKSFDKHIAEAIKDSIEKDAPLTLLMIDVDHFKNFNDQYGHQIGDEVLKIVAKSLTDSVKGMDMVARYGGEEFTVILPKTPIKGGLIVAEGIRNMIASKEVKRRSTGENYGRITVSLGVATYRPGQDTMQSLIKRADAALYRSKHSGRNRVTSENAPE